MAWEGAAGVILAIIIGTLAAIVYSLRVLILLERRLARIDTHIEIMAKSILKDEEEIEHMIKSSTTRGKAKAKK